MSHPVKYLVWRDGRPRWVPGSNLRARGAKGTNLKDTNGHWLDMPEAMAAAATLNKQFGVKGEQPVTVNIHARRPRRKGFVYFVVLGDRIKIGFSATPAARFRALDTGAPEEPSLLVAVPGTQRDEYQLHAIFDADRVKGEWFNGSQQLMNLILRCVKARAVTFGKTAISLRENP